MLKGTWGRVDRKLDQGFHCVKPTEIGNAIVHCVFHGPLEHLGGENSFPRQDQVCSPHAGTLKNGLTVVMVETKTSELPQDSDLAGWQIFFLLSLP